MFYNLPFLSGGGGVFYTDCRKAGCFRRFQGVQGIFKNEGFFFSGSKQGQGFFINGGGVFSRSCLSAGKYKSKVMQHSASLQGGPDKAVIGGCCNAHFYVSLAKRFQEGGGSFLQGGFFFIEGGDHGVKLFHYFFRAFRKGVIFPVIAGGLEKAHVAEGFTQVFPGDFPFCTQVIFPQSIPDAHGV